VNLFCLAGILALKDWKNDGLLSICAILSLASIVVPLLLLSGIRFGLIDALEKRLLQDPTLLMLNPVGSANGYTKSQLDEYKILPQVAFIIPKTRNIAANLPLEFSKNNTKKFITVGMEPTAMGDPLLESFKAIPANINEITLSATAAQKLDCVVGDIVTASLGRRTPQGRLERTILKLKVFAILPLEAEDRNIAFVLLPLLENAERYRDYLEVPEWNEQGLKLEIKEKRYASFRLYAKTMNDVAILREMFTKNGLEVYTKAKEIQTVQGLKKSMTILFSLIAITVAIGFLAATASNVMAGVRRKDKSLAMLRLLGFSSLHIMLFPILQALTTGIVGTLFAAGIYLVLANIIDMLFAKQFYNQALCVLPFMEFLLIFAVILCLSLIASLNAARKVANIEPSNVLREL